MTQPNSANESCSRRILRRWCSRNQWNCAKILGTFPGGVILMVTYNHPMYQVYLLGLGCLYQLNGRTIQLPLYDHSPSKLFSLNHKSSWSWFPWDKISFSFLSELLHVFRGAKPINMARKPREMLLRTWPFWDGDEFTWPELKGCWSPTQWSRIFKGHGLNHLDFLCWPVENMWKPR